MEPARPSSASGSFTTTSRTKLEPISAAVFAAEETRRRDKLQSLGPCRSGCRELDEYVLLGGLERGCVVGVSAEEEDDVGVLLGLQIVAHSLLNNPPSAANLVQEPFPQRALVITPKPAGVILRQLRSAVEAELRSQHGDGQLDSSGDGLARVELARRVREALDKVMLSCVFDLDGLWEVLADLDAPEVQQQQQQTQEQKHQTGFSVDHAATVAEERETVIDARGEVSDAESERDDPPAAATIASTTSSSPLSSIVEIQDSQDDDDDDEDEQETAPRPVPSPSSRTAPQPQPENRDPTVHTYTSKQTDTSVPTPPQQSKTTQPMQPTNNLQPALPEKKQLPTIILVTHFSALLTSLFTHREKSAAHTALQLLSSHLRYLSRNLPSDPLIILLNSTSSSTSSASAAHGNPSPTKRPPPPPPHLGDGSHNQSKALDPTLRSIFNPPALPIPGYSYASSTRRNKPTFGLVFAQLLDMHLLCTRLPRTKEDAEILYGDQQQQQQQQQNTHQQHLTHSSIPQYVTVIEVLLDEMGVWEKGQRGKRKNREQRWAAVDVVDGRMRDAFRNKRAETREYVELRFAAGFGGPRV